MHYYKRNIGDYAKKAGRLSMIEHGAYTLLLDACYDRERFPTLDEAIDWLNATSEGDIQAVKFVLEKLFSKNNDGRYIQNSIQQDIKHWHKRGWRPHHPDRKPLRQPIDKWKLTRVRIFERDNYTCSYCGQYGGELECDHIHPVSKGGSNDDSNLTTACKACNRDKSDKTLSEWRGSK